MSDVATLVFCLNCCENSVASSVVACCGLGVVSIVCSLLFDGLQPEFVAGLVVVGVHSEGREEFLGSQAGFSRPSPPEPSFV